MSLFIKNTLFHKINLMPSEIGTDIEVVLLNKLKNEMKLKERISSYEEIANIKLLPKLPFITCKPPVLAKGWADELNT